MSAFQIMKFASEQALDIAANVLAGATLTFSLTGTSTATNAYADKDLTTPLANPLSADSAGNFVSIFLDPTITYRVILKSSAGATLKTWDPANEQLLTQALIGLYLYPRTTAETTAGVTPVNYAYPPADARRYGFDAAASAETNTTAIHAAIASLPFIGLIRGGTVSLPEGGEFGVNEIIVPAYTRLAGSGSRATQLNYTSTAGALATGDAFCITLGSVSGVVKYGCAVMDVAIVIVNKDGHGVRAQETIGAYIQRLYIEGYTATVTTRTNVAVTIDGGDISSFFNHIDDVICNHVRTGARLMTSGGQRCTAQFFTNFCVAGDSSTYGASSGYIIEDSQGDGSVMVGGNIESCHTGIRPSNGALSFAMHGTRFEGCTFDISSGTGQKPASFFGINTDSEYNVSDLGNIYTFVGCTTLSGAPWINRFAASVRGALEQVTYSASITPSIQYTNEQSINVTNGTAFTINAPTGIAQSDGQLLRITIRNSSGGALGAVTWNAIFKMAAWTQPANGFSRSIQFRYDGVDWIEVNSTTVDVPN